MENQLGSSLNQIQGWTTVQESYSRALEQGSLSVVWQIQLNFKCKSCLTFRQQPVSLPWGFPRGRSSAERRPWGCRPSRRSSRPCSRPPRDSSSRSPEVQLVFYQCWTLTFSQKLACCLKPILWLQGVPSARGPWLGWLWSWQFHWLPDSAEADSNFGRIAGLCCNGITVTEVTEVTAYLGIFNLT